MLVSNAVIEKLTKVFEADEYEIETFIVWFINTESDADDLLQLSDNDLLSRWHAYIDAHIGTYHDETYYAYELYVETAADPNIEDALLKWPLTCIDWEKAAEELRHAGDVWYARVSRGTAVFRGW